MLSKVKQFFGYYFCMGGKFNALFQQFPGWTDEPLRNILLRIAGIDPRIEPTASVIQTVI
jgi:hypothetical protein